MIQPYNAHGVLSCDCPGCPAQIQVGLIMRPQGGAVVMEVVYLPKEGKVLPEEEKFQKSSIDASRVYCPLHWPNKS